MRGAADRRPVRMSPLGDGLARTVIGGLAALLLLPAPGLAQIGAASVQIPENQPPDAPIQFGPLYLSPSFELRDIGFDNNVFNDDAEERDFTATPSATMQTNLLAGPLRLTGGINTDYIWYRTFSSERSVNSRFDLMLEGFFDRYRPWVSGAFVRTRAREGFEIDARAQRTEPTLRGGLDWVVGSRTALAFSTERRRKRFAELEQFQGANLSEQLDNTTEVYTTGLRFELTPLTMLLVDAEYTVASFDGVSVRDSEAWSMLPTLRFQPDAYISGELMVGYKTLTPDNPTLVGYAGIVARGNLTFSLLDITQFAIELERDTEYSSDELHPYYVQTGAEITITQRIGGPFDVRLVGGRYELAYRDLPDPILGPRGTEQRTTAGVGVGYRLGQTIRFGVNGQFENRRSTLRPERDYDRTVYYASISYLL